jgi:NADH-quinone oxidoreductase subunit G
MPSITVNGVRFEFAPPGPGQPPPMILQVANAAGVAIPQYCYHDALSVVASCRICLAEVWMPNPKAGGALEPWMGGKLLPTCQTAAADGMVVYTDSPKAVANQKAVMEYLLINHPLDCPVCDQAGECWLQDYSYQYGRGVSRFEEAKVKNPKKDLGPHVYLYADRCIMCTRCVRFTREVSGTAELMVQGRGNREEIDIFPGQALGGERNPLASNVVDLCPVGALLDKDFLFAQRVWFLKRTPSIDGLTASGDNIFVEHNEGRVYRVKPRTNMAVNKWWITDEVRYGWKFVHGEDRLATPRRRQFGVQVESDYNRALLDAADGLTRAAQAGRRIALLLSPMLSCEDAFLLLETVRGLDPRAIVGMGPVPVSGQDRVFPPGDPNGFRVYAEKCPNRRGVERVVRAVTGSAPVAFDRFVRALRDANIGAAIITGNYPSDWASDDLVDALGASGPGAGGVGGNGARDGGRGEHGGGGATFVLLIDTLAGRGRLAGRADVLLPAAAWVEKAGTFQNARDMLQAFEQAIPPPEGCRAEGQIALDLAAALARGAEAPIPSPRPEPVGDSAEGGPESLDLQGREDVDLHTFPGREPERPRGRLFNAAQARQRMAAAYPALLGAMVTEVRQPAGDMSTTAAQARMEVVEL